MPPSLAHVPGKDMPFCRCPAEVLVLHAQLVYALGQGKDSSATQSPVEMELRYWVGRKVLYTSLNQQMLPFSGLRLTKIMIYGHKVVRVLA